MKKQVHILFYLMDKNLNLIIKLQLVEKKTFFL
eukprot:UN00743